LQHPGGVLVVPVTPAGEILMIRQYRYPVDAWCLEVPAGGLHEQSDIKATARRELAEETGARCGRLEIVSDIFVSNSLMDEVCWTVLAWDTVKGPRQGLEKAEFITLKPMPAKRALWMARQGKIKDAKSALALLMCEEKLRKKGFVP
jgi:ADP-ribose pyrophosphatase